MGLWAETDCGIVTQSVVRCLKRNLRPHHFRRRFWAAVTMLALVFILAWPFTQSTIVLQSPLISRVGHFPASRIPSSSGGRSLGFFVGLAPLGSGFFPTACFIDSSKLRIMSCLRGLFCAMSFIQSFPSPAHLAISVKRCRGSHAKPHEARSPSGSSPAQKWSEEPPVQGHHHHKRPTSWQSRFYSKFSVSSGRPIFHQLFRRDRDVLICSPPTFRPASCEALR